jgi:Mg2+-importing ATPase
MLPIQILLNNFLYDVSQVAIPTDEVDEEYIKKPRPWDFKSIVRFMFIFGPVSSLFDFITYGVLLLAFHAAPSFFHTGWFLESLCSQTLVIYVIRTNKIPFIQSRPNKLLLLTTLSILLLAFILPFTHLAKFFGLAALPLLYFVILAGMMLVYLSMVHVVKSWLARKYGYQ